MNENEVTFRPEGDIVAATAGELRSRLRTLLGGGPQRIQIDLAKVEMVDSVGLGLLIATHNSLQKAGGQLSIIGASADIFELLTTMRIHQHFPISSEERGVSEASSSRPAGEQ